MKRASLTILLTLIPVVTIAAGQPTGTVTSSEKTTATVSDREQNGLRGPVRSCTEDGAYLVRDAEGKTVSEEHSGYAWEYDIDGHILVTRATGTGAGWVTRYSYDASGRLLKTISGEVEGKAVTETTYSYDHQGRLQSIREDGNPDRPITFRYDERGRKSKIAISRPEDYRPDTVFGGSSLFEAAGWAPNLPGGGTATTMNDEHDRATEVQVRDARGELVNRVVRTYDPQGHVLEEQEILDNPENFFFPAEVREELAKRSGLSSEELRQKLRAEITEQMAGQPGLSSVSYSYDAQGRLSQTTHRLPDSEDVSTTTYNEQGDVTSEITRRIRVAGEGDPSNPAAISLGYSEVNYAYKYDDQKNWIEKADSYRSSPDGTFQPSTVMRRTLTYY